MIVALLLSACGTSPGPVARPAPTPSSSPSGPASTRTSVEPVDSTTGAAHVIPDGFPLLDGLPVHAPVEAPSYGATGPNRTLPPLEPTACGRTVAVAPHVDLLRGGWSNAEDSRERQLVAFASRTEAASYVEDVLDLYRACPQEEFVTEPGGTRTTVVPIDLSPDAGAATVQSVYDGHPQPGLMTVLVVRVESYVLVSLTSNEGGGGPAPEREAVGQRDADVAAARAVVRAMHALDTTSD